MSERVILCWDCTKTHDSLTVNLLGFCQVLVTITFRVVDEIKAVLNLIYPKCNHEFSVIRKAIPFLIVRLVIR